MNPSETTKLVAKSALVLALGGLGAHAQAEPQFMQEFERNGLVLSGGEYWPFHGSTEINYPDDVLWGFYPVRGEPADEPNVDSATPEAIACAELAFRKLERFIDSEGPVKEKFRRVVELGADHLISNKFYLWTNDYTRAADPYPHGVRPARLWYWTRSPQIPGRSPGYWKWESTVTQDGVCHLPDEAQIEQYIDAKLSELGG